MQNKRSQKIQWDRRVNAAGPESLLVVASLRKSSVKIINTFSFLVNSIYWTTFESTKRGFEKPTSEKNTFILNFFCGSVAGSIAALVTLPFDVVKTHQQIELGEKEIYTDGKVHQRAANMKNIALNIYKNNGFKGLFTGLLPRIFKVAPACAIMIATFEYGKQFFQKHNTQKYKEKMQRPQEIVLVGQSANSNDYS
ncbi:unnamed protein product [Arctia plantaginis]|uniref:Mitochondrial carrier protein n=1 Tax=Arctia plantaginis TaxID=874455 RepID=A0A8S1BM59_ARCPL|nr:unnamed protein product [Arctia plantaginis]